MGCSNIANILRFYLIKSFHKPSFHLLIPHLLQPLKLWYRDFQFQPESPNLSLLLSQFERQSAQNVKGLDASLFASIGLNKTKELPIAYYRYQNHKKKILRSEDQMNDSIHTEKLIGKSLKKGGDGYSNKNIEGRLLCADPVHLEVGLNDITLTQQITDLTEEEAKQCIDVLNQHFGQDGLRFIYGSCSQWYLLLDSKTTIKTTSITEVLRKNIAHFLPVSNNTNWSVIQNEAQMVLHASPVNQKREMAGLPTLNSLWFYGGGLPETFNHNLNGVYGNNEEAGGMISAAAACDYSPLPEKTSNLVKSKQGRCLVVFDQLMLPAIFEDIEEYQKQLNSLDRYIEPMIKEWKSGDIELVIDSCDGERLISQKKPRWKLWPQKKLSLTEIAR